MSSTPQVSERFVPLNKIKRSPQNVRTVPHTTAEIAALAKSIDTEGLLQNFVLETERDEGGKPTGFFLATAGEGRRLAHLLLVKHKKIKKDHPIRSIVDPPNPRAASLAENSHRTDMHPADQFVAFKQLVEDGLTVEEVAARFSVSPLVVARRLKLANVAPMFLDLFRKGKITLQHVMALALTDDHEKQQRVWDLLTKQQRQYPELIRRALTEGEISVKEPLVRFVGVETYMAAGGGVRKDLFADGEEDVGYATDATLLQELAQKKLEKRAAQLRKEGFGWVEIRPALDYSELHRFGRVGTTLREPTAKEAEQLAEIEQAREKIQAERDATEDDERLSDLEEQECALQEKEDAINEGREIPDPAAQAVAGAIVAIGHDGKCRIERGLLKPEDARRIKRGQNAAPADAGAAQGHSVSLMRRLSAHRTLALRATLAQRPDVALLAITHRLMLSTFYRASGYGESTLQIDARELSVLQHAKDLETSKANVAIQSRRDAIEARLPETVEGLFSWLADQPRDEVMALLAFCVSLTVLGVHDREELNAGDALAKALHLNMREWWAPTAEGYFGSLPKERILAAVSAAVDADTAAPLAKLKKGVMAAAAAECVGRTDWLPEPLRTPK